MEEETVEQEDIETPAEEEETSEQPQESLEERLARFEKERNELEEKNKKLYARLKKEEKPKEEPKETPPASEKRLSDEDLLYLSRADIHDDDLPDVREYAEKMGKSIKEAHKFLTPVLERKAEERKAAEATNTNRSPRGSNKPKGADLLSQAHRGQLPSEDDDASINALVEAEAAVKKEKQKDL